jgi:hypothetical protein
VEEASHSILLLPTEEQSVRHIRRSSRTDTEVIKHDIQLPTKNQLGTFSGVFVPTIIGTLGGVVLLRLSWIVGIAGNIINLFFLILHEFRDARHTNYVWNYIFCVYHHWYIFYLVLFSFDT